MVGDLLGWVGRRLRGVPAPGLFRPADLAVAAEHGLADPAAVGIEDGGAQLPVGELGPGPLQERADQGADVPRLDVARDAEPELAATVEVGLDVTEVARGL